MIQFQTIKQKSLVWAGNQLEGVTFFIQNFGNNLNIFGGNEWRTHCFQCVFSKYLNLVSKLKSWYINYSTRMGFCNLFRKTIEADSYFQALFVVLFWTQGLLKTINILLRIMALHCHIHCFLKEDWSSINLRVIILRCCARIYLHKNKPNNGYDQVIRIRRCTRFIYIPTTLVWAPTSSINPWEIWIIPLARLYVGA